MWAPSERGMLDDISDSSGCRPESATVGCLSRFGLGRSFRRERLRWEKPKRGLKTYAKGPWPMTSQLAALQRTLSNREREAGLKCGHPRQEAAPMGDCRGGARGSIDRAVVLVD